MNERKRTSEDNLLSITEEPDDLHIIIPTAKTPNMPSPPNIPNIPLPPATIPPYDNNTQKSAYFPPPPGGSSLLVPTVIKPSSPVRKPVEERPSSSTSHKSAGRAKTAKTTTSTTSNSQKPPRALCGCFPLPHYQSPDTDSYHHRWIQSKTMRSFWRTTAVSLLILLPGLLLHFLQPDYMILDIKPLVFFASFAIALFLLPFIHLVLHVALYHIVPEKTYVSLRTGNFVFYASEGLWQISAIIWFLSLLALTEILLPRFTYDGIMEKYPLQYVNAVIGVFALWTGVLGVQRVLMTYLITNFNKATYIGRIRELLFIDFVIETLREAKRRIKLLRRLREEVEEQPIRLSALWLENPELRKRFEHLVIPPIFLKPDEVPQEEKLSAYSWKRVLDHFYSIVLQDDVVLEVLGREDGEEPEKVLEIPKLDSYHPLHRFGFDSRHRRLNRRRSYAFNFGDDKASRIAGKIFKILKRENETHVAIKEDIIHLFESVTNTAGIRIKIEVDPEHQVTDTIQSKRMSVISTNSMTPEMRLKEEQVKLAVHNFFVSKGESQKISERDLRQIIQRSFRERRRLVESLSGMKSVVAKINDFVFIILCLILLLSTLTIFGVDAFGALLSFSSAFLSFAFLFGRSARNLFEGLIFILFIHPYDVGDRIIVNTDNYIVSKISLLCTVLERWDGQLIYMPNSKLATFDIFNLRRSAAQAEQIVLKIAFTTPNSVLEDIGKRMSAYAESENADFEKKVGISVDLSYDLETLIVKLTFRHRLNWQNWDLYLTRRGKMYRKLIQVLKELNVTWTPLSKPVDILNLHEQEELQKFMSTVKPAVQ